VVGLAMMSSAVLVATFLVFAGSVAAEPADPTDFVSEVVRLDPVSEVVEVQVVGSGGMLLLTVEPGHEVLVLGVAGEPYLRFRADGLVFENLGSPTGSDGPSDSGFLGDEVGDRHWSVVSQGGRHQWHEHRAHWTPDVGPFGAAPGTQILEGVVPIVVDGVAVDVVVGTWWLHPPTKQPAVIGVALGAMLAVVACIRRRLPEAATLVSVLALMTGGTAWFSVSAAAHPSPMIWFPALVALLAGVAAIQASPLLDDPRTYARSDWLVVASGSLLVVWSSARSEVLSKAFVATELPLWWDRSVISAAFTAGVLLSLAALGRRMGWRLSGSGRWMLFVTRAVRSGKPSRNPLA
jgi:hypothetical protein